MTCCTVLMIFCSVWTTFWICWTSLAPVCTAFWVDWAMPIAIDAPNDSHDFDRASMQIWMIFCTASPIRSITVWRAWATACPACWMAPDTARLACESASSPPAWLPPVVR
jgi:hypothetical protein